MYPHYLKSCAKKFYAISDFLFKRAFNNSPIMSGLMKNCMNNHPVNIHHTFLGILPSYFARKVRSQVRELFVATAILDLATAMVMIFEPIYLYRQGYGLRGVMLFYLGVYVLYFFLMPLGAKFAKNKGFEKSIFIGTVFQVVLYGALLAIQYFPSAVIIAVFCYALQKTFFWPGYHADFAWYGQKDEWGKEIGNMIVISSVVYIIGPFLGGLILALSGFTILFVVVSVLILMSNIPLLITREQFEPSEFSYWRAYRRLFRAENRRKFISYIGFGEELIVLTVWPIFIYLAVQDNLFSVGGLIALSTLATSVAVLYIGRLTDESSRHRDSTLRAGSLLYSFVWVLRTVLQGPLGVFLLDTGSRVCKSIVAVPMMAITYNQAQKTSIMKSVVFFEMSLVMGKISAILLVLVLISLHGQNAWSLIFMLAAVYSLLYATLQTK